jgi:protein-tyrosine-phosphatase
LSRADTEATRHQLYVKVVGSDDPDQKSRGITLDVLRYIHARLPAFAQMGIAVKVNKIRSQDLQNARLIAAMQRRGIRRLPALTTPNNVYLGAKEIADLYERNIKELEHTGARGERPVEGAAPDDGDLDSFFRDEMTFERAEEDAQEPGIGEGGDMMDAYRRMMERRESSEKGRGRRPAAGRPSATTSDPSARAAPPRAPASSRPDNVGRRRPVDDPDDEIQATIDRLARDIDGDTRDRAFASGGGDSLDDDGGYDPQDDLMEKAYWGSRVASSENL